MAFLFNYHCPNTFRTKVLLTLLTLKRMLMGFILRTLAKWCRVCPHLYRPRRMGSCCCWNILKLKQKENMRLCWDEVISYAVFCVKKKKIMRGQAIDRAACA